MELVVAAVEDLRPLITRSFEDHVAAGPVACALSGGATALIFLGALRDASANWSRVSLFWADERAVAPDDPDSNFGIAQRMLLGPLGGRAPRAFRMPAEMPDLQNAALAYEHALERTLGDRPLDLAILGIGEDGHICSLFPGHPALFETGVRVVAVEDAPKPPPRRLSLSLPFVCQTREVWVIAVGPRKRPVLHAAMERRRRDTPLDMLLQDAPRVVVFTDQPFHQA
jgi:6-phosphogluconolactonase